MNKINNVLKSTKGPDSHISIYVFEKTDEEIKEIKARLPKEFYVEVAPYEDEDKDDWTTLRADNFAGFEYVEIILYPKEEDTDE